MCEHPPHTAHPGDVMFIMPEMGNGTIFHVAYEGRVVDGELEQRAALFRTSATFWEVGDHEWERNEVPSRATYKDEDWVDPHPDLPKVLN